MNETLQIVSSVVLLISQILCIFILIVVCRGSSGSNYHSKVFSVPFGERSSTVAKYRCACTLAIPALAYLSCFCALFSAVTLGLHVFTSFGEYVAFGALAIPPIMIYFYNRKARKVEAY